MATLDEWRTVCAELRSAANLYGSPRFGELYGLMRAEGAKAIRAAAPGDWEDLLHRVFEDRKKLDSILSADNPKSMFRTIVKNHLRDWKRRKISKLDPRRTDDGHEPAEPVPADASANPSDDKAVAHLDRLQFFETLPERKRDIVLAVALGESREEVAERLGTTRANVDKIVSRVAHEYSRRKAEPPEPDA